MEEGISEMRLRIFKLKYRHLTFLTKGYKMLEGTRDSGLQEYIFTIETQLYGYHFYLAI